MQQWQRNPQHRQREHANARAEQVRKNHAAAWTRRLGRTRHALVQDLVEAVQHAADADDQVAQRSVVDVRVWVFLGVTRLAACAAAGLGSMLRRVRVAIRHDQHADDGHGDREHLAPTQPLAEERYGEGVCKKSRAVVDRGQVGRGRHAHGDVPRAAGNGQSARNKSGGACQIRPGVDVAEPLWCVDVPELNHERRRADVFIVSAPECAPGHAPLLDAEDGQLQEPQHRPRAMRKIPLSLLSAWSCKRQQTRTHSIA